MIARIINLCYPIVSIIHTIDGSTSLLCILWYIISIVFLALYLIPSITSTNSGSCGSWIKLSTTVLIKLVDNVWDVKIRFLKYWAAITSDLLIITPCSFWIYYIWKMWRGLSIGQVYARSVFSTQVRQMIVGVVIFDFWNDSWLVIAWGLETSSVDVYSWLIMVDVGIRMEIHLCNITSSWTWPVDAASFSRILTAYIAMSVSVNERFKALDMTIRQYSLLFNPYFPYFSILIISASI